MFTFCEPSTTTHAAPGTCCSMTTSFSITTYVEGSVLRTPHLAIDSMYVCRDVGVSKRSESPIGAHLSTHTCFQVPTNHIAVSIQLRHVQCFCCKIAPDGNVIGPMLKRILVRKSLKKMFPRFFKSYLFFSRPFHDHS